MHSFLESRITDPKSIDTNLVQGIFDSGQIPTIQFSAPTYSVKILEEIDDLCCLYQDKIEIRFFDHYQSEFDARILARIPNVVLLSIDCLRKIKNLEQISNLKKISRLNFGVFEFDQKEVLEILPLNKLKHLTIGGNRKNNFDLASLILCSELQTLYIDGHTKNIEVINGLSNLSKLTLRAIPKSKPLGFLTACEKLLDLTLIIGGRQSITDFSLPSLESLCITWVRGLEDLGPMSRFPRLKHLIVEDQLRLKKIDISKTDITNLRISNCKNLDDVQGLSDLKNLKSFLAFRTKLPLEGLLNLSWPESLEVLGLYSTSKSWNDDFEKLSAAKGYRNTPDS